MALFSKKRCTASIWLVFLLMKFGNVFSQSPPRVIEGPYSTGACTGSKAFFTGLASSNTTINFWLYSADQGASWDTVKNGTTYEGATTNALVVHTTADMNNYQYKFGIGNNYGYAVSGAATLYLNNTPPLTPSLWPWSNSVCQGGTIISTGRSENADTLIWSYSGVGATFSANVPPNFDTIYPVQHIDTVVVISFGSNATSGTLSVAGKNACGTSPSNSVAITVNPLNSALPSSSTSTCYNDYYISSSLPKTLITDPSNCSPIAGIVSSGASPITGPVSACVTVDASVQTYNGVPYVPRHYDIEATSNPTTSTATITLYFSQSDFDTYNSARGTNPALPTGPADATGVSNIRITQFHGTGTTPGTYVGGSGEIIPAPGNVIWNASASRWEITFDITGFSGFFLSSGYLIPLPLTLLSFNGQPTQSGNQLTWSTSKEVNTLYFELQRSTVTEASASVTGFQTVAKIAASGNNTGIANYQYTDPFTSTTPGDAGAEGYAYRLRMVDQDGNFTYSKTVLLRPSDKGLNIHIIPNPFHNPPSVTINVPSSGNASITIADLSGKLLLKQETILVKGANAVDLSGTSQLQQGIYLMTVNTGDSRQTIKLWKN